MAEANPNGASVDLSGDPGTARKANMAKALGLLTSSAPADETAAPETEQAEAATETPKEEEPKGKVVQKRNRGAKKDAKEAKESKEADAAEAEPEKDAATEEKTEAATGDEEKKAAEDEAAERRRKAREERREKTGAFAELKRFRADLAKRERDIARKSEELTKSQAEFSKVQQEYADLNKLRQSDPEKFLRQLGGGSLRPLLETVLKGKKDGAQPGPEESPAFAELTERYSSLEKKLDAALSRLDEYQTESQKKTEEEKERQTVTTGRAKVLEALSTQVNREDYPFLFTHDVGDIAETAFDQLYSKYRETGEDVDLLDVLDQMEERLEATYKRLSKVQRSQAAETSPPAQDNGAATSRQTPGAGQISNSAVAARASTGATLTLEEKRRRAARLLTNRN